MSSDLTEDLTRYYGPNAGYVLDLYERYQKEPASVDDATRAIFEQWTPPTEASAAPEAAPSGHRPPLPPALDTAKLVAATRVARRVRWLGYLKAPIDPLGGPPPGDPALLLETHGLTTDDLAALPASIIGGPCAEGATERPGGPGQPAPRLLRLHRLRGRTRPGRRGAPVAARRRREPPLLPGLRPRRRSATCWSG